MKLVFSDSPTIDELTLGKLMLVGTELTFVERPSIRLDENYGTVAVPSNLTQLAKQFSGSPVTIKIGEPPTSVFASNFYKEYFLKDFINPSFIDTVIDGIEHKFIFHWSIYPKENRNEGQFKDYRKWIIDNRNKLKEVDYASLKMPEEVFKVTNEEEAIYSFKTILSEQSLRVTSVLTICEENKANPISISPFLNKLISQRLANSIYTGRTVKTQQLGFHLMESFIPDEALSHMTFDDIIKFREKTKAYYDAWEIEIIKLESQLIQKGIEMNNKEIQFLIDQEINPKLFELKREIEKIRDDMFATILKVIKNMAISVVAGGTLSGLGIHAAIAAFIATVIKTKTPKITDKMVDTYFKSNSLKKDSGLTYLLKINQLSR